MSRAEKIKKLSLEMIRWAERNKAQRVTRNNRREMQNPYSEHSWQDDFTFILKCEQGELIREKKIRLNKIWKAYNRLKKYNLRSS